MFMRIFSTSILIFILSAVQVQMPAAHAQAESVQLGTLEFTNSGAAKAQADFVTGVLYLHSFEYAPARAAFQRAQQIDPSFAMAYWGEAMTYHHALWTMQWPEDGRAALMKLGATLEEREENTPTEREQGFIRAAEIVFGMTEASKGRSKLERDVLYRNQMHRLYENYPGDLEITAFYGLSILGVGSADRDYATYIRAAAVIMPVWDANRSHPGGAHYLIHALDDPVHAILALPMANAYIKIAPDAAHAQHMTSHIYTALGLWDDVVAANLRGFVLESAKTTDTEVMSQEERHYTYWLIYGRLQQGRWMDAEKLLAEMRSRLDNDATDTERAYFGAIIARYMFDTEDWNVFEKWGAPDEVSVPTVHYNFARAFAAIKRGDLKAAKQFYKNLRAGDDYSFEIFLSQEEMDILRLELDAMFALARGESEPAETLMRKAHAKAQAMPFRYGPPRLAKPTGELLGDVLFELGKMEMAAQAYEDELANSQRRTNSLLGLARAAAHSDQQTSQEAYEALDDIWHDADPSLPMVNEVRALTAR